MLELKTSFGTFGNAGQEGDERMRTENRQQEPRRDVSAGSFLLEKNHRDDTELARICRRYEGVACLNSNGKGEKK